MDEQRMLAEIERRLAAEDPGLATRLSSFRRPGPAARLRTTRGKIIGSVCTVVLLAVIGLTVYATVPFRGHTSKTTLGRTATAQPSTSAPVRGGIASNTSAPQAPAVRSSAAQSSAVQSSVPPTSAAQTAASGSAASSSAGG
ncbi:MAG TPA: DUF3040 domain-containing protein [Trebonia sp.]